MAYTAQEPGRQVVYATSVLLEPITPEEIKRGSVVQITTALLYKEGRPVDGGFMDLLMGPCDKEFLCATCGGSVDERPDKFRCPGHYGHIELTTPCVNPLTITYLLQILNAVCPVCYIVRMHPCSPMFKKAQKCTSLVAKLHCLSRVDKQLPTCYYCKVVLPKFTEIPGCKIYAQYSKDQKAKRTDSTDEEQQHTAYSNLFPDQEPVHNNRIYEILHGLSAHKFEYTLPAPHTPVSIFQPVQPIIKQFSHTVMGFKYEPVILMIRYLLVLPPCARGTVLFKGTTRSVHDLTYQLQAIQKFNVSMQKAKDKGTPEHQLYDFEVCLQKEVCCLMDNDRSGLLQSKNRMAQPIKGLTQGLEGKGGRVRGNLMGKRVDFSARSVITPEPNLRIDQLGIPKSMAMTMTYPEEVSRLNVKKLRMLIRNGHDQWPGARNIIKANGRRIDLRFAKKAQDRIIDIGDKVERHVTDGDVVLFNRQPSLHKMSAMAFFAKVLPWSTFRLNLSCTTPFNADFDGDEMNLHVPQSHQTRAEMRELCLAPKQIVAANAHKPCMGIVQDALAGIYLFTQRDTFLERDEVYNILMCIDSWDGYIPIPAVMKPRQLWTGKQLFSILVHKYANLETENSCHKTNDEASFMNNTISDTYVIIKSGELLCGIVDKRIVGTARGSLIHIMWIDFGSTVAGTLLSDIQFMINGWLVHRGFSVGIEDMVVDKPTQDKIDTELDIMKKESDKIIITAYKQKQEVVPGHTVEEVCEQKLLDAAFRATEKAGKLVRMYVKKENSLEAMVNAGSKGSSINICQIAACVGQQIINGERPKFEMGTRGTLVTRCLPHNQIDDISPAARGWVRNSYYLGLTPREFWFHAMGGREGCIDTVIKTAKTGYAQRRLMKMLEDAMVAYDGTVRNAQKHIIQFAYGEDGMDGCYVENQYIPLIAMSDKILAKQYDWSHIITRYHEYTKIDKDTISILHDEYLQVCADRTTALAYLNTNIDNQSVKLNGPSAVVSLPVHLMRLISQTKSKFNTTTPCDSENKVKDLDSVYIAKRVIELCNKLHVANIHNLVVLDRQEPRLDIHSHKKLTKATSREFEDGIMQMLFINIRCQLASKRVLEYHYLNKDMFDNVISEIETRFHKALVEPGEGVGALAAQSTGEMGTQMVMNTFHLAGVGNKAVTHGFPAFREVIDNAKKQKGPSITVYMKEPHNLDYDSAYQVALQIECLNGSDLLPKFEVIYDPDLSCPTHPSDRSFVDIWKELPDVELDRVDTWTLRIRFDKRQWEGKRMTMQIMKDLLHRKLSADDIVIIHTHDNADKPVMYVRMIIPYIDEDTDDTDVTISGLNKLSAYVSNSVIRGIKTITKVKLRQESYGKGKKEWVLDTEGLGLAQLRSKSAVDMNRTHSNNTDEMISVFGIEVGRASLCNRFAGPLNVGSAMGRRHPALLADVMTHRGEIIATTRHGKKKQCGGLIAEATFECPTETLVRGAVNVTTDRLKDVSSQIMTGKLATIGTNAFQVFLNQEMLKKYAVEDVYDVSSLYSNMFNIPDDDDGKLNGIAHTPTYDYSDGQNELSAYSPLGDNAFSPAAASYTPQHTPQNYPSYDKSVMSPITSPVSPSYSPGSPIYTPNSPVYTPSSPQYSPNQNSDENQDIYSPTSPAYSPNYHNDTKNPSISPTSPAYDQTTPMYSPSEPAYSPTSPAYSPHATDDEDDAEDIYSPTSPGYADSKAGSYTPDDKEPEVANQSPYNAASPARDVVHANVSASLANNNHSNPIQDDDDYNPFDSPVHESFYFANTFSQLRIGQHDDSDEEEEAPTMEPFWSTAAVLQHNSRVPQHNNG